MLVKLLQHLWESNELSVTGMQSTDCPVLSDIFNCISHNQNAQMLIENLPDNAP